MANEIISGKLIDNINTVMYFTEMYIKSIVLNSRESFMQSRLLNEYLDICNINTVLWTLLKCMSKVLSKVLVLVLAILFKSIVNNLVGYNHPNDSFLITYLNSTEEENFNLKFNASNLKCHFAIKCHMSEHRGR